MSLTILDEVTKTSIELLLKEPFYAHFFSTLNKEVVPIGHPVATMAVGLRHTSFVLIINEQFWSSVLTNQKHRYGVVKHEVLHLIFNHLLKSVKENDKNSLLLNIAMDLVVNQYILSDYLPEYSIFLDTFPDLDLEKDQTYFYYYQKLKVLEEDIENQVGLYDSISAKNLENIKKQSCGLERHIAWDEFKAMSNTERELLDIQLKNSIRIARSKTSEKTYSQLPRGVRITIDEILLNNKPIVDWRRVLRLFSESSVKTKIRNTLKKASKRYGTTPGLKIVQRHKILVVLDTSGSILQDELKDFFSEVRFMWKRGAEVYIVECDSVIHKKYWYKGVHPNVVYGGGGTSFDLPLKFANEEFHPDAIVYFTDGIAMPPTIVSKAPILWVISKNGIAIESEHFTNLKGRKAKIL